MARVEARAYCLSRSLYRTAGLQFASNEPTHFQRLPRIRQTKG
jgi:hypothetical protein